MISMFALIKMTDTIQVQSGKIKEIPVSAVASQMNSSGFSAIKHKNTRRVVTVYSALSPGETDAGAVVARIENSMKNFKDFPRGVKIDYTGQIEEEKKQMNFLVGAFITGLV